MFSGWPRTMQVGGFFGFVAMCVLLASLSSSQVDPQPTFAAPPVYSVAGSEVGITGLTSMAKGDFNGDGTFQSPITAASFVGSITAVAIGDFNGDGKPDIAVSAWGGSGDTGGNLNTVAILLGNGDGTFQPPVFYQSINNTYGIAIGDFNNDGKPDIIVRNPEAIALSLGNGDGTFLPGYVILAEP